MSAQEWRIEAPGGIAYTPAEVAHIARAAQAFLSVVSEVGAPKAYHLVRIDLGVLPASVKVNWPQPGEPTAERPGILAVMDRRAERRAPGGAGERPPRDDERPT